MTTTQVSSNMIATKGLTFAYGEKPVLNDISLNFQAEDFTGIIGPNGSGKSTLLKLIGGILPSPSETVFFKNRELDHYKKKDLAASIAWIPQEKQMPVGSLLFLVHRKESAPAVPWT